MGGWKQYSWLVARVEERRDLSQLSFDGIMESLLLNSNS